MTKSQQTPQTFFFETLGNEVRWQIIHLLQNKDYKATAIAKELKYEQSLISHHLSRLKKCRFVTVQTNGKERIYKLNKTTILPLLKLADKDINDYSCKCCVKNEMTIYG